MPWFDDHKLYIEFAGGETDLKIGRATDASGKDITKEFKKAKKFKHHNKTGEEETIKPLPLGTVLVTERNPYCYWVCCADGWHYRCVG